MEYLLICTGANHVGLRWVEALASATHLGPKHDGKASSN